MKLLDLAQKLKKLVATVALEGPETCKLEPVFFYPQRKNQRTEKGEETVFFTQIGGLRRLQREMTVKGAGTV